MSVSQAQDEIDSAEFSAWLAYDRIDPFGAWRDDYRAGISTAAIANRLSKSTYPPGDFMPKFESEASRQMDVETMQARLLAAAKTQER